MNLKEKIKFILSYVFVVLFVTFGVVTVFSSDLIFDSKIEKIETFSKNIFLDNKKLDNTYIIYKSFNNLSKYKLSSVCNNYSKFVGKKENNYIFEIKILDKKCKSNFVFLESLEKKKLKKSFVSLNFFDKQKLFNLYSDFDDNTLNIIYSKIKINIKKLEKKLEKNIRKNFDYLKQKRKLEEFSYHKILLEKILENRKLKYSKLVPHYNISLKYNVIPNAGRPYRASYTDGIHHGWDIIAPLNTKVVALDYGLIVRIVRDFKYSQLNKIKRGASLTYEDKLRNLDILRGNQVWLKTSKGDLVFYSHLQNIPKNLKVGDIVERGTELGRIGISGVPDKNYKNYHLHFPIMKNPRQKNKAGKYSLLDYMKWDWYFKGKSLKYVSKNSFNVFE